MKAARVRDKAAARTLSAYRTDFHLMDAHVTGSYGGTGERFDWELAEEHPREPPLVLSGGLDPDNVAEAIAVARPFAVDVASGVEAAPGSKDHDKLARFFAAVDAAAAPV
jgi:phosphoribosylanthranilate isomerase